MVAQMSFNRQFVATMEHIRRLQEEHGYSRDHLSAMFGISKNAISRGMRIYLTALGKTPDSSRIEVKDKATELVKLLDNDEISLNKAEDELVKCIKQFGVKPINRSAVTGHNPELQLQAYQRAVASLEGICFGLEKLPDVIHSSIIPQQRRDIETRLAECRRIIERRINIIRRDSNGKADHS